MKLFARIRLPRGARMARPPAQSNGPIAAAARAALSAATPGDDLDAEIASLGFAPETSPDVSIVVPMHDQLRFTVQCLKSLRLSAPRRRFEVIVADDGSADPAVGALARVAGLILRRIETNRGFVAACNDAAELARGGHLVFLNNDTVVLRGWLDALIGTFADHAGAGLAGSMLLWPDGRLQEAGARVAADGACHNVGRGGDADDWQYQHVRPVDYCSGASLAIPRALWRKLGGFDRDFAPGYYEDTDLAFRVRNAGREVLYQPFSRAVHFEGVTAGRSDDSGMRRAMLVNKPRFAAKWAADLVLHPPNEAAAAGRSASDRRALWIGTATAPRGDAALDLMGRLRHQGWAVDFLPLEGRDAPATQVEAIRRAGVGCVQPPGPMSPEAYFRKHGSDYALIVVTKATAEVFHDRARRLAPRARVIFDTAIPQN